MALSIVHGGVLLLAPPLPVIAIGMWWNANTVSHNFIHLPFFRRPAMNRAYSAYLSLVLGFPQNLWKARHLAHHGGRPPGVRPGPAILIESALVAVLWVALAAGVPGFFWTAYLPGWVLGLALSFLHGHFEHVPRTMSHYGPVYNLLFLNDGYHVEHHACPERHWTALRAVRAVGAASRWPAILRWIDSAGSLGLQGLERVSLRLRFVQTLLLGTHERAIAKLVPDMGPVRTVAIVGGGLFPRTAIVFRRLFPDARLSIIDASRTNAAIAQSFLAHARTGNVDYIHALFEAGRFQIDCDVVVIPLSLIGDRRDVYADPPAPVVLVHDWIWNRRGRGVVVSILLLKRINLVKGG